MIPMPAMHARRLRLEKFQCCLIGKDAMAGTASRSNSRWTVMGNVNADCPCCLKVLCAPASAA